MTDELEKELMGGKGAWWDAHQVATYIGKSPWWVGQEAREGRIPSFKLGRSRHFLPSQVKAWLAAQGKHTAEPQQTLSAPHGTLSLRTTRRG